MCRQARQSLWTDTVPAKPNHLHGPQVSRGDRGSPVHQFVHIR